MAVNRAAPSWFGLGEFDEARHRLVARVEDQGERLLALVLVDQFGFHDLSLLALVAIGPSKGSSGGSPAPAQVALRV